MLAGITAPLQADVDTVFVFFRVVVVGECPSGEAVEPGIAVCVVPVALGEVLVEAWAGVVWPVVGLVAEEQLLCREAAKGKPLVT